MNVYFDTNLIPTLSGNSLPHHALMGRPILPSQPQSTASTSSYSGTPAPVCLAPSSHEASAFRAAQTIPAPMRSHPSWLDVVRSSRLLRRIPPAGSFVPRRSPSLERRSAQNRPAGPSHQVGQLIPRGPSKIRHARSSSWSSSSAPPGIRLRAERSDQDPVHLLTRLSKLVPLSHIDPLAPPLSSCILHPPTLLSVLAFILEALVHERGLLTSLDGQGDSEDIGDPLRVLGYRTSLLLKSGSLDWSAMQTYLATFCEVQNGLMELVLASKLNDEALEFLETRKTFISKTRKVFMEVAALYTDQYSFVSGWWIEESMRESAAEVRRML